MVLERTELTQEVPKQRRGAARRVRRKSITLGAKRRQRCSVEPRLVPCPSGHTISRDDRRGGRSASRAAPAPLPPGSDAITTQPQGPSRAIPTTVPWRPPVPRGGTPTCTGCRSRPRHTCTGPQCPGLSMLRGIPFSHPFRFTAPPLAEAGGRMAPVLAKACRTVAMAGTARFRRMHASIVQRRSPSSRSQYAGGAIRHHQGRS